MTLEKISPSVTILLDQDNTPEIAGITIYSPEYFCPMDYITGKLNITEKSYSIHWYDASWIDDQMKKRRERSKNILKKFPGRFGVKLSKVYMTFSYYWEWIRTGKFALISEKLKKKLNK